MKLYQTLVLAVGFSVNTFTQSLTDTLAIDEIVVTATKSYHSKKNVPIETYLIKAKEMELTSANSAADVLRWVPGINISGGAPFGASQRFTALLRGLPAQYSLVLVDGQRVKSEHIHTGVNINLIPVDMIKHIEVVKGPSSALYGSDAMSGIINIITNDTPDSTTLGATVNYGSYNSRNINLYSGSSYGKIGYYLSGKYYETDGFHDNWYKQGNALGKLLYQPNEKNKITLLSRYYKNKYNKSSKSAHDEDMNFTLNWKRNISSKQYFSFSAHKAVFTASAKSTKNNTTSIQGDYSYRWKNNRFLTGIEARYEEFERLSSPYHSQWISSIYAENEFSISKKIVTILAIRGDYLSNVKLIFTPKASILYKINHSTNLRGSIGKGFRAPSLQDLYEYHYFHKTYWRDGNINLKPEHSVSYNLNVEHALSHNMLLNLSLFRSDFKDMIITVPTGITEADNLPVYRRENIKQAMTEGIEFECKYHKNLFHAVAMYTFLHTRDDLGDVIAYAPEHTFSFRTNIPFKRLNSGLLISEESSLNRKYKTKAGTVERLNNYALLNLNLYMNKIPKISINLSINNILDEKFESYEEGKTQVGFGRTYLIGLRYKLTE